MVDHRPKLAMGADLNERQSDGSVVISREMVSYSIEETNEQIARRLVLGKRAPVCAFVVEIVH